MKILRKKMVMRSRIWVSESNRERREAIGKINAKFDKLKELFVESPITEGNCYGTQNSLLWEIDKDNLLADERYGKRKKDVSESICPAKISKKLFENSKNRNASILLAVVAASCRHIFS